jgi:branched-chain amino acid transport system permease protein
MAFWTTILLTAAINAIAALGLFLQIRSGQFNIGVAVFVGVGGYVSGALGARFGLPPAVTIPISLVAGFLFGALFSALTLRLHHWFFAVTTLALSSAAVSGISLIDFFGGALGLSGVPFVTSPVPIVLSLLMSFLLICLIERSAVGLAIRATGDDQMLAQIFGVRVKLLRVMVFGFGAAIEALSGALLAHRFGLYQPTDLGFALSLSTIVAVMIGGKNSVWGPLLGTFFLVIMPEVIKVAPEGELLILGTLLLLVSMFCPDGLIGLIAEAVRRLRSFGSAIPEASAAPTPPQ